MKGFPSLNKEDFVCRIWSLNESFGSIPNSSLLKKISYFMGAFEFDYTSKIAAKWETAYQLFNKEKKNKLEYAIHTSII